MAVSNLAISSSFISEIPFSTIWRSSNTTTRVEDLLGNGVGRGAIDGCAVEGRGAIEGCVVKTENSKPIFVSQTWHIPESLLISTGHSVPSKMPSM